MRGDQNEQLLVYLLQSQKCISSENQREAGGRNAGKSDKYSNAEHNLSAYMQAS